MKSLFPNNESNVKQVLFSYKDRRNVSGDVYMWNSPDGTKIATHMILPCPNCGHPMSLVVGEFDFETKTLRHLVKCSARWKKLSEETENSNLKLIELNDKGKPVIIRCSWKGIIFNGVIQER